ncbi:biotin-dependent carboxyltransferase [bacterium]|nr:MAG: biotin-dependent carboxyltransferase [bacterium]
MSIPSHPRASILAVSPGFLTTVQDLGRDHCAHWGIPPSGAADPISLRLGNLLVGNPPDAAALEMTLVGGSFRFERQFIIALAGSDLGATLDNEEIPAWQSVRVKPGQTLRCGSTKSGARCYLCVAGGIVVQPVLSSASTYLLAALGGLGGRSLKAGDVLQCGAQRAGPSMKPRAVNKQVLDAFFGKGPIRVTAGPQGDLFSVDSQLTFSTSTYTVKEESDRMGLRLKGPALKRVVDGDIITEGTSLGAIQVPPDGEPIILFVEHPTTGGYPKIANVISADLHRVGQLRPRDEIKFEFVKHEKAISLLKEQEDLLSPQRSLQAISQ